MATMPTYEAATRLALGGREAASEPKDRPLLRDKGGTLDRAEQAYRHAMYQSNTGTAAAFFVTCAIAVGTEGSAPIALLGLLALALLSAASSMPLAQYRFRAEIESTAKKEGLSVLDAQQLARTMLAEWSASTKSTRT